MSEINVLSPQVAALIAAGEVVERPSSVIKELIENSIDAGARSITAEIKNGGITYMRVTDDGSGMERDDIPLAITAHATSKIKKADDLESIVTLGFRGEALHSVAAVSSMEILTAKRGSPEGSFARVVGGRLEEVSPAGCPEGTTITVRELFYNTPARMKFLKKDSSEAGLCEDVVRRIALARPDISVRFISSGKEIFSTPGDNILKNAVYAIYGKEFAAAMTEADYSENGIRVYGLVGKAELSRGNRNYQTFFVNGRCVINKTLYFALQESYKSHMMTGRFPAAVLNIEINPALCDVNVHPSKAEIKFADDRAVSGAVYWAAKNALYSVTEQREMQLETSRGQKSEAALKTPEAKAGDIKNTEKKAYEAKAYGIKASAGDVGRAQTKKPYEAVFKSYVPPRASEAEPVSKTYVQTPGEKFPGNTPPVHAAEQTSAAKEAEIRILGQLFGTYIVAEYGDSMIMADQHAAHERLIYEELAAGKNKPAPQLLLMPETLVLTGAEFAIYSENADFFTESGFEIEEFGHNTVRISMIPAHLGPGDAAAAVTEMLSILGAGREKITALRGKALYSVACRAALKAGQRLSESEQRELIKKVLALSGQATCPHGRPVILKLTRQQIEKQFKRII